MTRPRFARSFIFAVLCASAAPAFGQGVAQPTTKTKSGDDDLARELPRIKPLEPAEALKSFQLHEGFRLEPVAAEPLVTDPVSVCYDADGRLYVVEMRGYPYPEKTPTGNVTPARGQRRRRPVRPQHDLRRRPLVADGRRPLRRRRLHRGRARHPLCEGHRRRRRGRRQEGDLHRLRHPERPGAAQRPALGARRLDLRRRRAATAARSRTWRSPTRKPVSVRGRDFRFKPDGSAFEAISGGGQFGHAFDDWGHRFTCNNSNHIRQIVLPSRDLERNPALVAPAVVDDIAAEGAAGAGLPDQPGRALAGRPDPPARGRPGDASSGCRPPSCSPSASSPRPPASRSTEARPIPPEYRGNAFIGDVGGNLVHRKILTKHGAEFRATRADAGRRVPGLDRQLVPARQLRQHARRHAPDPRHVPRDDRAPALDPRADQEAPRPDQRQGPRPALRPRPRAGSRARAGRR